MVENKEDRNKPRETQPVFQMPFMDSGPDEIDAGILNLLTLIVKGLVSIKDLSKSQLMSISVLESDRYIHNYLKFLEENQKHVKRKHSHELSDALEKIASALANRVSKQGGV